MGETWSTVSARLQGKLEARLWYKGNLKHGYGTSKLEARLWYKGNLKHS